jgi:hypothetical protein
VAGREAAVQKAWLRGACAGADPAKSSAIALLKEMKDQPTRYRLALGRVLLWNHVRIGRIVTPPALAG